MREPDAGSETRLMRRAREAGMTRTEATEKRLAALERFAKETGLTPVEQAVLAQHVMNAAAAVFPDQATPDYLRSLT
jgi:hypothetical protein